MVIRPVRVDNIRVLALCVAAVVWVPCVSAIYRGWSAGFVSTGAFRDDVGRLAVWLSMPFLSTAEAAEGGVVSSRAALELCIMRRGSVSRYSCKNEMSPTFPIY